MSQQINNDSLKKIFPGIDNLKAISINLSRSNPKLSFRELLDYKIHPCENMDCPYYPRTTVANNQYIENELKCIGYHHARDQRRQPIRNLQIFTGEFEYQANYFKEGKCPLSREKYSNNFFESLYHPLYYKQFICKRDHCEKSAYCPYFHTEKEKVEWEVIFEQNLKLNRKLFLSTKTRQTQSPDSFKCLSVNIDHDNEESTVKSPYSPYQILDIYNKLEVSSNSQKYSSKKTDVFHASSSKQYNDENTPPPGIYNQFGSQNISTMLPLLFASRA